MGQFVCRVCGLSIHTAGRYYAGSPVCAHCRTRAHQVQARPPVAMTPATVPVTPPPNPAELAQALTVLRGGLTGLLAPSDGDPTA